MKGSKVRPIALLLSDMDGTLLHPGHCVSLRNTLQRYNQ